MKDLKTINKAIDGIRTAGAKLDTAIQNTAVDVLEHYMEHRDTGLVNRLFLALPKGARGMALADWLLKFVAVKVNTNKENKETQPFVHAADKVDAMMAEDNLKNAIATHWHSLKREKALDEVFDLKTAVKAMLRKIESHAKVEHFDRAAVVALAKSVGIPESDVPTKPGGKVKTPAPAADPLASVPPATV